MKFESGVRILMGNLKIFIFSFIYLFLFIQFLMISTTLYSHQIQLTKMNITPLAVLLKNYSSSAISDSPKKPHQRRTPVLEFASEEGQKFKSDQFFGLKKKLKIFLGRDLNPGHLLGRQLCLPHNHGVNYNKAVIKLLAIHYLVYILQNC